MAKRRITETSNQATAELDKMSTAEMVKIINDNDKTVAECVEEQLDIIAALIDMVTEALKNGGRLFYIGAGTSGRLGVMDAAECPPTYGVSPELVQAIVSGGQSAVFRAREGCEDLEHMGARDLMRRGFTEKDVVVGLSASGRTPYVCGALNRARKLRAKTGAIICNPQGRVCDYADVAVKIVTGPEVVTGSTRMKAGTAQKMALNMLSTAVMVKLGRVSGNLMTNMQITCSKLVQRAIDIITTETGVDEKTAAEALRKSGNIMTDALKMVKQSNRSC